jgi:hypothetical protein
VVATVGGLAASSIASGASAANGATSANAVNKIVRRDASGDFAAGTITANTFIGSLTGNATNVTGTVEIANGGTGATTIVGARSNLGLGSAATLNVGTTANSLVQLDASAKLPSVDGSLLTNVVGTDSTKLPLTGGTLTGTLILPSNSIVAGTNQLVLSGGNVGIGSSSPGAKLDVTGGGRFTGQNALELPPFGAGTGDTSELRFDELLSNGSEYVGFKAPNAIGTSVIWTLPAMDGSSGHVLSTNGSGTLSWVSPGAGSVTSITAGTGLTGGPITSTGTISLADVGTAGTFTKVTTNAQGQVTGGAILADTDIPNLDAGKITTGTLSVALGGTGATSFTNNGVLVGTGTSPLSATVAGTQYQVLRAGSGGVPAFGAINLDQAAAVSGALGLTNGGTGASTAAQARTNLGLGYAAILNVGTAASDIIQLDASGKLPVVDGTQVTGVVKVAGDTMTGVLNLPTNGLAVGTDQLVVSEGNVGIGTATPRVSLDLSTRTDAFALPSGTTGQQPVSPVPGWLRYNADTSTMEFYNGTFWKAVGNETSGSTSPPGMVSAFPMATCPAGWLETDGSTVSRSTYASLFEVIGTIYGAGNGSTTFKLPDYRGYFLRSWSHGSGVDPDAASRSNRGDGTTGDNIGTIQGFQLQSHSHNYSSPLIGAWKGMTHDGGGTAMEWPDPSAGVTYPTGGNETRPKNVNVIYCINTATSATSTSGGSGSSNYIPLWTSSTILGNSPLVANNGNVGIGSTAPSTGLDIISSTSTGSMSNVGMRIRASANGAGVMIGTINGNMPFISDDAVSGSSLGLAVYTAQSERMRITDVGNIGIGTTSPTQKLHIVGDAYKTVGGTSWATTSDVRLKLIGPDYEYGLDEIRKLHTVRYRYKDDNPLGLSSVDENIGIIAQEVQSVIPEAIRTGQTGYLELHMDPIHWAVVNAVQQLASEKDAEIAQLKAESLLLKADAAQLKAETLRLQNETEKLRYEKDTEITLLKQALCSKIPGLDFCQP